MFFFDGFLTDDSFSSTVLICSKIAFGYKYFELSGPVVVVTVVVVDDVVEVEEVVVLEIWSGWFLAGNNLYVFSFKFS